MQDLNLTYLGSMSTNSTQPNILLIRLSAIGDIVMASGLPSSIKNAFPHAKVTWLVEKPYADLVRHHTCVDNVICWPKNEWRALSKRRAYFSLLMSVLKFRKQLKQQKFTHAIEAQGLLKSAFLAFLSGAKQRIGFNSKERSQLFLNDAIDKPISDQISSEYRYLAAHFGAPQYRLHISMGEQVAQHTRSKLTNLGITSEYVALAPFTTRAQKHWPVAHWKQLITLIRSRTELPIVILGGPSDSPDAESLTVGSTNVYSSAGHFSLAESADAVRNCRAFVGVDTGLTHMATAYLRPTVALFGSTCPYTYTDNDNTHVLYKALSCSPCKRKPTCGGTFDCMTALLPQEVDLTLKDYL